MQSLSGFGRTQPARPSLAGCCARGASWAVFGKDGVGTLRPSRANLTDRQTVKLAELLQYNLQSVRSYLLREDFQQFWEYTTPGWAVKFLQQWCIRAMRSKIEPMKKVARSLRQHRRLILNWFRAKGTISSGTVEGLNNKAKLTFRKSYGFRTFEAAEIALYHTLGELPEPEFTHEFC